MNGWTEDDLATLRLRWFGGATATEVANALGGRHTRNSVLGKVHRLHLHRSHKIAGDAVYRPKRVRRPTMIQALTIIPGPRTGDLLPYSRTSPKFKPDVAALRSRAWEPLPGSSPVPVEMRTGCSWPVGSPVQMCNEPRMSSLHVYCDVHDTMSKPRV